MSRGSTGSVRLNQFLPITRRSDQTRPPGNRGQLYNDVLGDTEAVPMQPYQEATQVVANVTSRQQVDINNLLTPSLNTEFKTST